MDDLLQNDDVFLESTPALRPGYRLYRLEVYNWGTFDSRSHQVHVIPVAGETALLIGQNGSGKSTLVDALLTLLVKPGNTRNYNLAAGASKGERNERTYIKGAYGRRSQEEAHKGDVQYLRSGGTHYSVLLASFRSETTNKAFTLAQILYLGGDGHTVEKLYCFAPKDLSIAENCAGLKNMDRLAQQMKERGFSKTSRSFVEYHEWLRKATGLQQQAMDLFNQTVAMKDVGKLNDFIRRHMLQAQPWEERVDNLLNHFQDLSDTHRDLLRIRKQHDLLLPVAELGLNYRASSKQLERTERMRDATDVYFQQKVVDLYTPARTTWTESLELVRARKKELVEQIAAEHNECARLQAAIDQEGGTRLQLIPSLIDKFKVLADQKRGTFARWVSAVETAANVSLKVDDNGDGRPDACRFRDTQALLPQWKADVEKIQAAAQLQSDELVGQRGAQRNELRECEANLASLQERQGNLPPQLTDIRRRICHDLDLGEEKLRFAAELMMVKLEERNWEASIEMALNGLARTLLVPAQYYNVVSHYVDRTRLQDTQGRGQRLVYRRIGEQLETASRTTTVGATLYDKLAFRDGHSLLPWLKAELRRQHNFLCCETIEEFQQAPDKALTRNRQAKSGAGRHEKDDRDQAIERRNFVLGWDNKEKKRLLAELIGQLRGQIDQIEGQIEQCRAVLSQCSERLHAIRQAASVIEFAEINFEADEQEIESLLREKKALEEGNEKIRVLKQSLAEHRQSIEALEISRDRTTEEAFELEQWIKEAETLIGNAQKGLAAVRRDGSLPRHVEWFDDLSELLGEPAVTTDNWLDRKDQVRKVLDKDLDRLRHDLDQVMQPLVNKMAQFLRANGEEKLDLQAGVAYLDDFLRLLTRITEEDLPRHEQRFKERLNEQVGHEVGVLRGSFMREKSDILERIRLLNASLRKLDYQPGTFMRLEMKDVRDPEIREFQQKLEACINNQLDSSEQANEERFNRIRELIERLRDTDDRLRRKVTDVRNWFDFSARELESETGAERSYHEDSSGQSGGEKAKLAFTILVAAIAYQYDLDPTRPELDRFHFVVVDEMFSRIDDRYSQYALELFQKFGLQLLIVAPLDAKARVTEPYVDCYLLVTKRPETFQSEVARMTVREFREEFAPDEVESTDALVSNELRRRAR